MDTITAPAPGLSVVTGMIFNIMRFAVNDGPGIRTTVFLKGCPLECAWCHNPESRSPRAEVVLRPERCIRCGSCVEACPHHAVVRQDGAIVTSRETCEVCGECVDVCAADAREIVGREMAVGDLMDVCERDRVFYDQSGGGVTFSGGEPLQQHEFLFAALQACLDRRLHTVVDTTGCASPTVLERVAALTDLFLYDLKGVDDEIHRRFTGVSNRLILENLRRLVAWKKRIILRVPLIPGVNDDPDALGRLGAMAASLGGITELHVLPYHEAGVQKYARLGQEYALDALRPPPWDQVNAAVEILRRYVPDVSVGG